MLCDFYVKDIEASYYCRVMIKAENSSISENTVSESSVVLFLCAELHKSMADFLTNNTYTSVTLVF